MGNIALHTCTTMYGFYETLKYFPSVSLVYSGQTQSGTSQQACTSYPCLIFEDNFDFLNFETWTHEITASGGGVCTYNCASGFNYLFVNV